MDAVFRIDFRVSVGASDGEPERFLTQYSGDIFVYREGDDEYDTAGKTNLFVVHATAAEHAEVSLYDVLDLDAEHDQLS